MDDIDVWHNGGRWHMNDRQNGGTRHMDMTIYITRAPHAGANAWLQLLLEIHLGMFDHKQQCCLNTFKWQYYLYVRGSG